ncbi:unnamed protein product [Adineta ricciae]|uniref:RBR-type E3 ubiquitin transferase n=2 Tax=Adineta ricciae TaxID=249248 RepID=A0A814LI53_ADIRI|nr:unnamed protein product [Adineta ricciae]
MSESEADSDDCFYNMAEDSTTEINDEPATPADDSDENFYEIDEHTTDTNIQAYIDEPITPTDETNPNFHYTVMTTDEYVQLTMRYVDEVKDVLQLSSSTVKLLLHHFKWNKQRLLEDFYEKDPNEFFQQAKVINPFSQMNTTTEPMMTMCLICCSDEEKQMFSLKCRHTFCTDCWKTYLINQIVNEGLAQTIVCPDSQCEILVDEDTVRKFLHDDEFVQHIYTKIVLNSYIDNNPRARWCPGKNCERIINASSLTSAYNYAQLITCNHCQTSFCFQCSQPWHDPIKCVLLSQWNKKLFDDTQTIVWLKVNTKICPKCRVNIEKNGGCNHMTCRNCTHEFCWICFGKWATHTECNRYDDSAKVDPIQAQHALALSRYLHYHDRFREHEHSYSLEAKLYRKIKRKLTRNVEQLSTVDIQMIKKAFEILLACRRTLTYTYPFAYYLVKNNQSDVFEQNQADLERACEELSELLEKNLFDETVVNDIRRNLSQKSKYCDARKCVLLKHVKEGYTNNYWEYFDDIKANLKK